MGNLLVINKIFTCGNIHRLYLKHGKPSVILHNRYSLNYSKLENI